MMKENNIINHDVMIQFMFPSLTPSVKNRLLPVKKRCAKKASEVSIEGGSFLSILKPDPALEEADVFSRIMGERSLSMVLPC